MGENLLTSGYAFRYGVRMTVTREQSTRAARTSNASASIAAEVRAEAARQGVSLREIASTLGVSQPWITRRVSVFADVELKVGEIERLAEALGVPVGKLLLAAGWPGDVTQRYQIAAAA